MLFQRYGSETQRGQKGIKVVKALAIFTLLWYYL